MAIKMIVTDLDRTLLKDDKTISPYTAQTLEALRRQGIPLVVATARPPRAVRQELSFLRYDGAVYHNGAITVVGDQVVDLYQIDKGQDIVAAILRERPESFLSVEMGDALYTNMLPQSLMHWRVHQYTPDFHEIAGRQVEKILISSPEGKAEDWLAMYKKFIPEELYMQVSENTLIMVMNREATKLNGIRRLAKHYAVNLEEVAAFGDDFNDMEMLCACGVGVAVANAIPEVKAAADEVCGSNEGDGVARWIEERLL